MVRLPEESRCKNCRATNFVSKSAESISDEVAENVPNGIAKALHIIGIITIGFGVVVGIALLISFNEPVSLLFAQSKAGLTFTEVAIAFGTTLFYCVPGVFCLGIAKIIELLEK